MTPGRYFYSRNGTDVAGPATEEELRRLWSEQQLGVGSYLCREGELTWMPLTQDGALAPDLTRVKSRRVVPSELFAKAMQAVAPAPPVEVSPAPVEIPPAAEEKLVAPEEMAPAREEKPVVSEEKPAVTPKETAAAPVEAALPTPVPVVVPEPAPVPVPETVVVAAPVPVPVPMPVAPPPALTAMAVPPRAKPRAKGGLTRTLIYGLSILLVLGVALLTYFILPRHTALAEARAMNDEQKQEAQKEIANKGFYTADNTRAEQNIQQLKGQLTDNSETSRIGRDILAVTTDLLDKVKVSDALEANCKFTLDAVKTSDDLSHQIDAIGRLLSAQGNVVTFLQAYDQHCRDALTADHIAPATQEEVIAEARKGAHVDLLITLWQQKIKLSEDHASRFLFLQKNWGSWQYTSGQVIFANDTQASGYDEIVASIQDDVAKIRDTQKQIFQ